MNIEKLSVEPEKIRCAAIVFLGETFEGATHVEAIEKLQGKYPGWATKPESGLQDGFMTTHSRFIDRKEAYNIARETNQMKGKSAIPNSLRVEDLIDSNI